jgi:hypothetical protein
VRTDAVGEWKKRHCLNDYRLWWENQWMMMMMMRRRKRRMMATYIE